MTIDIFTSREEGEMNLIQLPMVIDHKNLAQFENAQAKWLMSSCLVHVMDLNRVVAIMPSTHKSFVNFHKNLREQDKSLFSINTPAALMPRIRQDGLFAVFNPVEDLDVVQRILEMKRVKREEVRSRVMSEVINAMGTAAHDFLKLRIGIDVISTRPFLKNVGEYYLFHVGGLVEIAVDNFDFSILIQFDRKVFESFFDSYSQLEKLKNQIIEMTPKEDIQKCAKRILNPIFTQAKLILKEKKKILFKQVNPNIIVGDCCKIHEKLTAIVTEFQTELGNFRVEVGIL